MFPIGWLGGGAGVVAPPFVFWGCVFGVVFSVVLVFGGFFCVFSVLFCCCSATEWLLFCLRCRWGWFPGVFRVPSGVWRCFHVWMSDPLGFGGTVFRLLREGGFGRV